MSDINLMVIAFQAWAELQFIKNNRELWLMTELKCFDAERSMTSTILKPLPLVSVSGASIALMSAFVAAMLLLIVESYTDRKSQMSTTSAQLKKMV